MKNIIYKNKWTQFILLTLFVSSFALSSCKTEDDGISTPIKISKVYLENVNSSVPDREVQFARLSQTIRLEGSGFVGVQKVFINGYKTYFNPVLISDNSMLVTISRETPTLEAPEDIRNTIRLEKSVTNFVVHPFEIRAAAPSITRISHTMPQAGELIVIYGTGLQNVTEITFPGDIVVTKADGIESDDERGRWCTVIVPNIGENSGEVFLKSINGGAYSPAYFNRREGLLQNFDDKLPGNGGWSSGEVSDDLTDVIPAGAGNLPKSQGTYRSLNKGGKQMAASENQVDLSRYWMNLPPWEEASAGIAMNTSTANCGVQMDIYYEGEWNSGHIRFVVADGWGASRYSMLYAPWAEGGNRTVVENFGCWFTITFPFSNSEDFKDLTLESVLNQYNEANYKQSGPWLENGNMNGVESRASNLGNVYFDNIRVVPLAAREYSDYPE